ncbi:MAG: hypothetical protein A2252_11135 [Elusimicrobia bacterium RIFOXYA2_FULL_39_19]|nr:MAG: hypothetical protein A2252_11135 [Elusimicrobia bacterium RIFOXYA2_FULL_39_19]
MKKKVLLLTASYGTGHVTASKFIQKSLNELFPNEIESKIIDFLKVQTAEPSEHIFEKIYNWTMEKPRVWDKIFDFSNTGFAYFYFKHIFSRFYQNMFRIFENEKPDFCVTTHPYWNFIIDLYNKKMNKNLRYSCVITDSTEIHATWINKHVQDYMICDNETKEAIIKKYHVLESKLKVTGFPVNPELGKPIDREKVIKENGLDPAVLTILFVVGLGDYKKFLKIIDYLAGIETEKFQMIIITGKYKNIYDGLMQKTFKPKTKVVGWTDKMPDYLRSCDLVVAKCGGAIVMETLSCGKPLLIPVFTPGQERGNAALLRKYGYGFVEQDFNKIIAVLKEVIANPDMIKDMQSKVKQYSKPLAAEAVAKIIAKTA